MVMAHGGTAGAIGEVLAFILPLALFAALGWRARRANEAEEEALDAERGAVTAAGLAPAVRPQPESRWTRSNEKAGRQMETYSAPSAPGVL